jgi:hypothetical protein
MSRQGAYVPARRVRRLVLAAAGAAALVVAQAASGLSVGFTVTAAAAGASQTGHPNRVGPTAGTRSVNHLPAPPRAPSGPRPADSPPPRGV